MHHGKIAARSGRARRRVLALVVVVVALSVGAVAVYRASANRTAQDPYRIQLLTDAAAQLAMQKYDRASALLDERAAVVPPTPLDWWLRAQIAEARGRPVDALEFLARVLDSDAIGPQARLKAGQLEMKRHRAKAAEAAFRRAVELDPDRLQPHRELAYLYAIQLRKRECDEQFRALAERMPLLGHVLAFAWCQSYCRLWDPNEAGAVLSQFLEQDPDDRASRIALATSYQASNRPKDAESVLRPLPDSDPDVRALRIQLAIDQGEVPTAERLADGGPAEHVRLNCLRGRLALFRHDARKAATFYRAAVRDDPDDRDAIHGLGTALKRLGDPESKTQLELAARHDQLKRTIQDSVNTIGTDTRLFDKLGDQCESLGRLREARAWYQLAISRDPLDSEAHKALNRIEAAVPKTPRPPEVNPTAVK